MLMSPNSTGLFVVNQGVWVVLLTPAATYVLGSYCRRHLPVSSKVIAASMAMMLTTRTPHLMQDYFISRVKDHLTMMSTDGINCNSLGLGAVSHQYLAGGRCTLPACIH